MNPHEETGMDGDSRLVEAFRSLYKTPTFSLGAEIAKANEQWNQGARIADSRCPSCGRNGYINRCENCERG